jgi:hypothetical protein
MRPRVYTASKLDKSPFWKQLRLDWPEVDFTARWVDFFVPNDKEGAADPEMLAEEWRKDHEDVARADFILVWGNETGTLRGALVEAGIGLALGKTVIVVGETPCYGTWKFHKQVKRVGSFEEARAIIVEGA